MTDIDHITKARIQSKDAGFTPFPSIEGFAQVCRLQNKVPLGVKAPTIEYGSKIKLHGTNAGIRITCGKITAQSRNRDLTPENDNAGFAAWVEETRDFWAEVNGNNRVIFGEWAGPGVHNGAPEAVAQLPRKHFFIFAIFEQAMGGFIVEPADIRAIVGDTGDLPIRVLDWHDTGEIDFSNGARLAATADSMSQVVEAIGGRDPYLADEFGIEGPGEGLVFMPRGFIHFSKWGNLVFKVKAEAHRVQKTKQAASVGFQPRHDLQDLAESYITPARCEQALEAIGGVPERARMSDFLKWIGGDVKKESAAELEAAGVDWKAISSVVGKTAAAWFLARCEEVRDVA